MPQHPIRAGVAELDITPPMGVEMWGYGPYEKRVCTEVLDPLYARALWLESAGDSLLIITCDLCSIDLSVRNAVAERLHEQCAVPEENILVAASHTHSGPAAQPVTGWGECDQGYMAALPGLLVQAALDARSSAGPARVGACRQRIEGVGVNREQTAFGPTDTAAQLLRVDKADGAPLAVMFNFGAHAATRHPYTTRISADWSGLVAAYIKVELQGAIALFLQGPCGNINAHKLTFDRTDLETHLKVGDMRAGDVAQRFGDQVLPALKTVETKPAAELKAIFKTIHLPCVPPDRKELEKTIEANAPVADSMSLDDLRPMHERIEDETPAEVAWRRARFEVDQARRQLELLDSPPCRVEAPLHVMRIGDAAVVGWPGEIFVELGLELRQRSPIPLTFVASFANDCVGYIPTPAAYESQGKPHEFGTYPTSMTPQIYRRLPFRPDVGRILVDETLALLNEI